jgi:hypothetical protein
MNTSVVSAAIIEGSLIIGLSDGSVINCGFVQGPQGLSGPQGPMGATGDSGTDGNTILTFAGTPGNEMGSDGDYAIDNVNWRIYGPKAGGVWGKAKEMLPGPENILENGRAPSGGSGGGSMGGSGSGGGGGIVYTNTVQLTNPTRTLLRSTANYKIIPNAPTGSTNQEDANNWAFGSVFDNFDAAIPVATGVLPPTPLAGFTDNWDGRLWFDSSEEELTLYIYNNGVWIPAAPPVSLDSINATIDAALITQSEILTRVSDGEAAQTALISETVNLQNQIDDLAVTKGSVARYKITATSIGAASRNGELYVMSPNAADVQAMSFAPFDLNGQPTKPCNVGDIIELVEAVALASIGEVTRYRIVSGDYNALTVEYLGGTNNFVVDETQEVYIYPQNEAGASKDYVDAQDNALKSYIDTEISNLPDNDPVPLDDLMTLTGTQRVSPGNWRIQQATSTGGTYSYISVDTDELKLYHLQEPTQSHHAATKAYVDAKPSGGSGTGISASRPPGLKFNVSIVNLPNGYFQWWTNNSTNNQHLELATTDRDGIAWGTNTLREDVRYNDKIPFTIWEVSNNAWKMKVTGTISRIDFHPDHALCYVSSKTALNGGNFVNGAGPYYITISGLF